MESGEHYSREREETGEHLGEGLGEGSREVQFTGVEELLRHDAGQVEVPERVEERLLKTLRSGSNRWWQRLWKGKQER